MAMTWTIAEAMNTAALECSVPVPVAWVASTNTNERVMRSILSDCVRELLRRHDWKQLTVSQTITGTGVESYALASDFLRLAAGDNAVYENSPNRRPCIPIVTDGDWTEINQLGFAGVQRYYRLNGSNIDFYRPLPTGATVTVSYVSKNWKRDSTGVTAGDTWAADADLSLLPGYMLELGVIWRFRRHKGLQYLDRKVEYESELARAISDDRPIGKVGFDGDRNLPRRPFEIPVPDFIPPL
jgi:hypothetical protein